MRFLSIVSTFLLMICFGQGFGAECTPAGTWFGGSEDGAKYLLTIVPSSAERYTTWFQPAFKPRVPVLSAYSGELKHVRGRVYDGYAISMVNTSDLPPDPGAASTSPQVWAVRFRGEVIDCDTFNVEIDFFAVYQWRQDVVPFKDVPDSYRLTPGSTIRESYRRMVATNCASCPSRPDDGPESVTGGSKRPISNR